MAVLVMLNTKVMCNTLSLCSPVSMSLLSEMFPNYIVSAIYKKKTCGSFGFKMLSLHIYSTSDGDISWQSFITFKKSQ